MFRRFGIATLSSLMLVAACKVSDKPLERADPAARPAAAVTRSIDPAAGASANPAGKSASATLPRDLPRDLPLDLPLDPELEAKGLAMMQRLADIVVADARDCEKLAADLKAFAAQNKQLLAQLVAVESQETEGQRAAFSQRNAAVQVAVAQKMQSAMTACAGNPSVLAALQEFPGE
jgi:hypothetical protein